MPHIAEQELKGLCAPGVHGVLLDEASKEKLHPAAILATDFDDSPQMTEFLSVRNRGLQHACRDQTFFHDERFLVRQNITIPSDIVKRKGPA